MQTIKHVLPNGKEIKLVTIYTLALAVSKDRQTLKRWERLGILPKAPFSTSRGKIQIRLYPEYYVMAVKKIIEVLGIDRGIPLDKIISKAKIYSEIDKAKKECFK